MAISLPLPIAIPISALAIAGASLIPSPTMATGPCSWYIFTFSSFSCGRTSAIICVIPAIFPISLAVLSLSPVSMTTCNPN